MVDEAFAFDALLGETVSNGEKALSAVLLVGSWMGGGKFDLRQSSGLALI